MGVYSKQLLYHQHTYNNMLYNIKSGKNNINSDIYLKGNERKSFCIY